MADALWSVLEEGANSQLGNAKVCPFSMPLKFNTDHDESQVASKASRRIAGRRNRFAATCMMNGTSEDGGDDLWAIIPLPVRGTQEGILTRLAALTEYYAGASRR